MAGDEYYYSTIQGTARYEVVRKETGVLLEILNGALGTTFALPAR